MIGHRDIYMYISSFTHLKLNRNYYGTAGLKIDEIMKSELSILET